MQDENGNDEVQDRPMDSAEPAEDVKQPEIKPMEARPEEKDLKGQTAEPDIQSFMYPAVLTKIEISCWSTRRTARSRASSSVRSFI